MIYVCNHCRREMSDLRTRGDDVNSDLICALCAEALTILLEHAREIQRLLQAHFDKIL